MTRAVFWQVSNKVNSEIIKAVTNTCQETHCKLSARIGETTLMATSDWYDKDGILHVEDHNRFTATVSCLKCGRSCLVDNTGLLLADIQ